MQVASRACDIILIERGPFTMETIALAGEDRLKSAFVMWCRCILFYFNELEISTHILSTHCELAQSK